MTWQERTKDIKPGDRVCYSASFLRNTGQQTGEGSLDGQVSLWEDGQITGRFELHVPQTPQIDTSELTESDLDTIAAGLEVSCCSCPCCCCA